MLSSIPTVSEPGDPSILNLIGKRVALGPLRRDLLQVYERWINDFTVLQTLGAAMRPTTSESESAWFERAATSDKEVMFTVYELETRRAIGTTGLREVDHFHRAATFGILIGEKESWGKGYGTETTRLMVDYAFQGLGLNNVMLTVSPRNERGLRAYRRAGFREIGRRRQAHQFGGLAEDVILMDCLATEFERPEVRWNM
jgi:RimJ/RimL family protein N-acetyltransferase